MASETMAETRRKEQDAKLGAFEAVVKALKPLDSTDILDILAAVVRLFAIDSDEL